MNNSGDGQGAPLRNWDEVFIHPIYVPETVNWLTILVIYISSWLTIALVLVVNKTYPLKPNLALVMGHTTQL